jgi:PAS domain S-box-containing protein
MNSSFEKPFLKKQRFAINAKIVIPLTIFLAFILIISALFDYWGSRRELSHILREQSQALITALEKGSQNAIASYDLVESIVAERLLDNARLLEEMDYNGMLSESILKKVAKDNNIFRINIFNENGDKVMASFQGYGWGASQSASDDLMDHFANSDSGELLLGFRSSRFGGSKRFAVAKKRRLGGVIVLNVDSEEMFEFRKAIGLGKLIRDIGENEGVEYIALQDTSNILIATAGVDSLSAIYNDPELEDTYYSGIASTRFINYKDKQIFEIIHLFDDESGELVRIGLNTSHIKEAQNSALTRAALSSLLLLIFGVIGMSWMISNQNVRSLKEAYTRIETVTGSMLENMTDAVVAVNGLGNITLVNKAAEDLFSVDEKDVLGKACAVEIVAICPYLKEGLESGMHKNYIEENLQAKKTITANLSVNVIQNEAGHADIVFAVIRDVTDMKRLEENLKRKDQITAMGHLASGVAHEIRNPLNAIGMIGQRLKSEFTPSEEQDEYSQLTSTVVTETRRINDIIQQFLQFARPAELVKTETDISKLIADVSAMLRPQAEGKSIQYIENCDNPPKANIDADKIKQVLLNLGQNAIDACDKDGRVTLSCTEKNHSLVFEIADNGKGMSENEKQKIFNIYYTTKEQGTGVGLSIVQQIISQHNGTIDVQSEENNGSVFTISLPLEF